ncbi:MAG: Rne/Rng family ribonuclease [Actinomycetota bacterium]|nr:Rne/Rng family ribonuclease [Actinomycetota bacterium]
MSDGVPRRREKAADVAKLAPATDKSVGPRTGERTRSADSRARRRSNGRRRSQRPARPPVERTMLVHGDTARTQIAVVEEGKIVEHYVARVDHRSLVGNIYVGRVQNVLPGMEASFVDIGEARNGVLYAGEVGIAGEEGEEIPRIETVLKSGQSILVQVTKDPMRSKGARLTALVSVAGRHLVLVPNARTIGVSRRLPDSERERLRDLAQKIKPNDHGLIVRTAAEGTPFEGLKDDLGRLMETWEEVSERSQKVNPPSLIYEEPQLELRVVRDLFNREISRCIVDDPKLESILRSYVRTTTPELDHRLELYEGALPIFEEFRVLEQIRKSLDRKVWLSSGGHIVIERTEAMTVIDVNTGKFVGKTTLEETVFKTNREAAIEIARQLRLRDIGGIIVIDFIDMEDTKNQAEVLRVFRNELAKDRSRTQVFEFSSLGLIQMTRKNVSTGIVEAFSDPCPECEARGLILHDVD